MCKYILVVFLSVVMAFNATAADTPYDKLLKASKKLVVNPADSDSMSTLQNNIDMFNESVVKASIIKVIGLAKLASDKASFDAFKSEMKGKYPWMDFSFEDEVNFNDALKKNVNYLALNASSALETQSGNAPSKLHVKPRTEAVEAFGDSTEVARVKDPVEVTEPEVPEVAKLDVPEKVEMKEDLQAKLDEASKTKPGDIDKESVYYKIYHAAVKAQKGDGNGIRELVQLTFDEKPEELTSAIVKTITLGMLSANSKSTTPYIIKVNSVYLDNAFLNFLDNEPFTVNCSICAGSGKKESKCRKCLNGKCRNCKGEGEIRYRGLGGEQVEKKCPTCEGAKHCTACKGDRVETKPCLSCGQRGSKFNKAVFKPEYAKALQYVIDLTPKVAQENNVYIGVGINSEALARVDSIRLEQKRQEAEEKARMKAEREAELARLEEERKKKMNEPKEIIQNGQRVIVSEFEVTEGESNENLEYAVFEFENYLKVQQKRTKSSIYEKVHGKYQDGKAMLFIEISDAFNQNGRGYKEQILDGFYRFWKLRAGANGAGSNVDVRMTYQGKTVAGTKNGEVYVN